MDRSQASTRVVVIAAVALFLAGTLSATAEQVPATALLHEIGPNGTSFIETRGEVAVPAAPAEGDPMRAPLLWRSVHEIMIGASTGISLHGGRRDVMVSHENYPPTPVEMFEALGDGTPYWTETGTYAQVAARGGVYALADFDGGATMSLTCWYEDLDTPAWTLDLPGCTPAGYKQSLIINMDATRVFFGCFYTGQVRFMAFEAATGTILVDTIIPLDSPSLRNMGCTDNGRFVDLNCGRYHVVYDVDTDAIRDIVDTQASTNPVGISESGEWLAAGFTRTRLFQWDPDSERYVLRWAPSAPGYAGVIMVSDDGYWITGWYSTSYNQNRFERRTSETNVIEWTTTLPTSPGHVQDIPVSIDFDRERAVIAVACWGDTYEISPEIVVLATDDGEELCALHAPGSMFDVAISEDGTYVSATGKLVHANIMGNGSDTYCAMAGNPAAVEDPRAPKLALSAWPNPSRVSTTLFPAYTTEGAGDITLRILDQTGRLVRTLSGSGTLCWNGTDDRGAAVPAGVYYGVMAGQPSAGTRIVMLR